MLMRLKSHHPSKYVAISDMRNSIALHSIHAVLNLPVLQAVEITAFIKGVYLSAQYLCVCDFLFSRQKMLVLTEVAEKRDTFHTMHMPALLVLSVGVKEVR